MPAWDDGTWVWYPWAGRLVHVLPREEFRLVRTDRNRGKIDRPAQRRLLDKRIGVIWHTQGSGKSLTMAFYAGKIVKHPAMANPTLVILTDRNDLDDQLFGTFSGCQDLLRQKPAQAEDRDQAKVIKNYIVGFMREIAAFADMIEDELAETVRLSNGVVV